MILIINALILLFAISFNNGSLFKEERQLVTSLLREDFPAQYLSGSIHYFRVHPSDWRDRLRKLKWAGFHAVQTYIEWSSHEPEPEVYDFTEGLDIVNFITIAAEEGLLVILRPGPYICAERDMGGIPWWLLQLEPHAQLRSSDEGYMKYVRRWFDVLLPLVKPLMVENGGPIIMVQVENEYGNYYICDFDYLTELADLLKAGLGDSTFLFSTDNGRTGALQCVKIPSTYATVDFGADANINEEFEAQMLFNKGPLINSEFYPGWLDHWGTPHQTKDIKTIIPAFEQMITMNASVNFYVFHGGTNFGFGVGSNLDARFLSCPTSYDYDAPINEAGDLTDKYFAIRDIALKYFPPPSGDPPANTTEKQAYGDVPLTPLTSIFNLLASLPFQEDIYTRTFEELGVPNGVVVYEHVLENSISSPANLALTEVHDRGYVYINHEYQGLASREEEIYNIPISAFRNQTITIVVESQGRISVGPNFNDFKGLTSSPQINGNLIEKWKMTPIPLYNMTKLRDSFGAFNSKNILGENEEENEEENYHGMTFYQGNLYIDDEPKNTFLRTDLFIKGYAWVNNFLLGRYWPIMGPQRTLYVPHGVLQQGNNTILFLELEGTLQNSNLYASFVDQPDINAPVPNES